MSLLTNNIAKNNDNFIHNNITNNNNITDSNITNNNNIAKSINRLQQYLYNIYFMYNNIMCKSFE